MALQSAVQDNYFAHLVFKKGEGKMIVKYSCGKGKLAILNEHNDGDGFF